EVAAGRGDPGGILEMRADTEADAALFGRCVIAAKADDRISRPPVAADAVQVQNGMAADTARELGAEAGLFLELGHGAELGIVGKEGGISRFRIGARARVHVCGAASRERERGDGREHASPKVLHWFLAPSCQNAREYVAIPRKVQHTMFIRTRSPAALRQG